MLFATHPVWMSFGPRNTLLCHHLQQFLVCLKERFNTHTCSHILRRGRRKRKLEKGLFAATPIGANQKLLVKYFCSLARSHTHTHTATQSHTLGGNLISHVWRGCHFRLPFKGFSSPIFSRFPLSAFSFAAFPSAS